MKRVFGFFCPHCDRRLEAEEKSSGEQSACPGCGREFVIPTKEKARDEDFIRATQTAETGKLAESLERRIELIRQREKKAAKPAAGENDHLPPWLKKAVGKAKKKEKNPLNGIEIKDMDGKDSGSREGDC